MWCGVKLCGISLAMNTPSADDWHAATPANPHPFPKNTACFLFDFFCLLIQMCLSLTCTGADFHQRRECAHHSQCQIGGHGIRIFLPQRELVLLVPCEQHFTLVVAARNKNPTLGTFMLRMTSAVPVTSHRAQSYEMKHDVAVARYPRSGSKILSILSGHVAIT